MAFIHPLSVVEGDVRIGKNVTLCAYAVLRGDHGQIVIGDNSNVQDCAVVHDKTAIGEWVSVGHGAVVHGAKICNKVIVGMNSTILNNAVIEDNVIIAAGAVVTPRTVVKSNSMVMGIPARVVRKLAESERSHIIENAKHYVDGKLPKRLKLKLPF